MVRDLKQHERYRWSYMSTSQLLRRLRRITTRLKLEAFMEIADEHHNLTLIRSCAWRMEELGFRPPPSPHIRPPRWTSDTADTPYVPPPMPIVETAIKETRIRKIRFK